MAFSRQLDSLLGVPWEGVFLGYLFSFSRTVRLGFADGSFLLGRLSAPSFTCWLFPSSSGSTVPSAPPRPRWLHTEQETSLSSFVFAFVRLRFRADPVGCSCHGPGRGCGDFLCSYTRSWKSASLDPPLPCAGLEYSHFGPIGFQGVCPPVSAHFLPPLSFCFPSIFTVVHTLKPLKSLVSTVDFPFFDVELQKLHSHSKSLFNFLVPIVGWSFFLFFWFPCSRCPSGSWASRFADFFFG